MFSELTLYNVIPKNKVISKVRERYYEGQKGPKSLDELCNHLSKTTITKVFDVLLKEFNNAKVVSSILTETDDDAGETFVTVDEYGNIKGIKEVEIPTIRRFSMMFFPYIFEATKVAYYQSRVGMKYEKDENWLVLPYFVTLYAVEHSYELLDPKTIDAVMSTYIVDVYSSLTEGVSNISSGMNVLLGLEDINPISEIIGITKAVTLYQMCKESDSFDIILQAVLDTSKSIGKELEYNIYELDIHSESVIYYCKKFIQEKLKHLGDMGEPDECERPVINSE